MPCRSLYLFIAGLMISLIFLVLTLSLTPYSTAGLNSLQTCALLVNVITLFVGIMLIITASLEDEARRAGQAFDTTEREIISVLVFLANMSVFVVPPLRLLSEFDIISNTTVFIDNRVIDETPFSNTNIHNVV